MPDLPPDDGAPIYDEGAASSASRRPNGSFDHFRHQRASEFCSDVNFD
jgi:hypothetical protein